jgi:hypothetical protein
MAILAIPSFSPQQSDPRIQCPVAGSAEGAELRRLNIVIYGCRIRIIRDVVNAQAHGELIMMESDFALNRRVQHYEIGKAEEACAGDQCLLIVDGQKWESRAPQ